MGCSSSVPIERAPAPNREPLPPRRARTAPPFAELRPEDGFIGKGSLATVRTARTAGGGRFAFKVMNKAELVRLKQVDHVWQMDDIAPRLDHPHLMASEPDLAHDARCVYQVMELCEQGDLYTLLHHMGRFDSQTAMRCAAQLGSALTFLHAHDIAHRNMRPEAVLLSRGRLKLGSFCFAKSMGGGKSHTLCGTPEYMAPELLLSEGHDIQVDMWALGVLTYELAVGYTPFGGKRGTEGRDPMAIYQLVLAGRLDLPRWVDAATRRFVKSCVVAVSKRLCAHELCEHPDLPADAIGESIFGGGEGRSTKSDYDGMPFDAVEFTAALAGTIADPFRRKVTPYGHAIDQMVADDELHGGHDGGLYTQSSTQDSSAHDPLTVK